MSRAFNPLHMVADSRFFMLITRAINHNRVVPSSADSRMGSARSSWSSASIVSSIDLKSPEPEVKDPDSHALEAINSTVRNRKLLISLITLLVLLILIGIVLGVVIPLIFMQNSSITTTVSTVTTTVSTVTTTVSTVTTTVSTVTTTVSTVTTTTKV
ncbi:unnamed protein product [Rotaria socialis]|uniref:Uncharacterized protein n=1 Tax=Rotaria socialis TaxID=392032 RepID=A0A817UKP5_9BILA|nr:unnamed protein product [Rotaria socialis]CAF3353365.1 unnamed protein product [Rotaria socialis]CAF3407774.1 unnamed protein product [Rotaria socialis]CAF4434102.1 unnamed protein product [Rotaria socialis]CAF4454513.1 unnamed protein product [Rotaria socialis]